MNLNSARRELWESRSTWADPAARATLVESLRSAPLVDFDEAGRVLPALLSALKNESWLLDARQPTLERTVLRTLEALEIFARRAIGQGHAEPWEDVPALTEIFRRFPATSPIRSVVLRLLALAGSQSSLAQFAEFVVIDPPAGQRDCELAFAALLNHPGAPLAALFPRLLDALAQPATAALVLDVANFAVRSGRLSRHPIAGRASELVTLLGGLVAKLSRIEESPPRDAAEVQSRRAIVAESVPLAIALCDALALAGEQTAVGKLHQALQLGHRRLRIEAAAALARLDDPAGVRQLVELAADAAARSRALAYLDELGQLEQVPAEERTASARAAATLADWLAEPAQYGVAPTHITLLDAAQMYWPGYETAQVVRLFTFEYQLSGGIYSGIGIVGPATQCAQPDLVDRPPADLYAYFAGRQASHPEIQERLVSELSPQELAAAEAALAPERERFEELQIDRIALFFGELLLVAHGRRSGQAGTLIVGPTGTEFFAAGNQHRPVEAGDALAIYEGRALLRSFNPAGPRPVDEEGCRAGEE